MDTDRALRKLGPLGRYQMFNYLVVSATMCFQACWVMLGSVFFALEPAHHCTIPEGRDLNLSIPYEVTDGEKSLHKCKVYSNYSIESNSTETCPNGTTYSQDTFTIVHQWELVCDRGWMVEMSQTVLVGGVMVGALVMSMLADRYGRKKVYLANLFASAILGCGTAGVTNYGAFSALRFLSGICQQGMVVPGFVLACEMFPAEYRTVAAMLVQVFWALGMMGLAGVAYLIRDWRHFLIATSIPGVLAVPLYWLLGESLPWLVAQRRLTEARKQLRRAARWNRVRLPLDLMSENVAKLLEGKQNDSEPVANGAAPVRRFSVANLRRTLSMVEPPKEAVAYTIRDIFRSRKLTIFAFIMVYLWCVNSLVYYGLSLSTGSLAGDVYVNFLYSGLAEIFAYLTATVALQFIGRRWPIFAFHALAGVTLVISTAIPKTTQAGRNSVLAMAMIGKFGITGSFGSIFLYAPELFPTTLRSVGIGLASVGGRAGNLCAPFSAYLARTKPLVIGALFGAMSLLAAGVTLILPETLGRPLATTIEEVEGWTRSRPRKDREADALESKVPLSDIPEEND